MKTKRIVINGKNFSDVEGFYDEVQSVLTKDFKEFGRNLDAFDDLLYGGFGKFNENEKIILVWKDFYKSKKELPSEFLKNIIEIINHHKRVKLGFKK